MVAAIRAQSAVWTACLAALLLAGGCGPGSTGPGEGAPDLLEQLHSPKPALRIEAARELGNSKSREAVEPLIRLLFDSREDVRLAAIEALGEIGSDRATEQLMKALSSPDWRVRRAAARALGRIGDLRATDALLAGLEDERRAVAYAAALAVASQGPGARDDLVDRLDHTNGVLRECAVLALGEIRDPRAAEKLYPLLKDPEPLVRLSVADALGKIGDTNAIDDIVALLGDHEIGDPGGVCRALVGMGEPAVPALRRSLKHRDRNVRRTVVEVLGKIESPAAVPALLVAAADRDRHVHAPAIGILKRRLATPGATDTVVAGLEDSEMTVRLKALDLLDETGHPKLYDAAAGRLADPTPELRLRAVNLLGRLKNKEAVEPLAKLTDDSDAHVRMAVGNVLVSLDDDRGPPILLDTLKLALSGDRKIRWQRNELVAAIQSLGRIRCREAVGILIDTLKHPDGNVGAAAGQALGEIGDKRAYEPLIACFHRFCQSGYWKRGKWIEPVMIAIGRVNDPRAVDFLLPYLQKEPYEQPAATALGFTGDKRVIEPIAAAARKIRGSGKRGRYLHIACAYALERIDREKIIPIVVDLLDQEPPENVETLYAYCRIFGRSKHPQAVAALVRLMRHDLPEVRKYAREGIVAMGETGVVELIKQLRDAKSGHRGFISVALAEIGEPAMPHLARALHDESPKVRQGVIWALGQSDDKSAAPKIAAMANDEDDHVRGAVAWALGEMQDPRGLEALVGLLADAEPKVRAGAAKSLGRIGGEPAVAALEKARNDKDSDVRDAVNSALGRLALGAAPNQ